jgi:hypothetical protein
VCIVLSCFQVSYTDKQKRLYAVAIQSILWHSIGLSSNLSTTLATARQLLPSEHAHQRNHAAQRRTSAAPATGLPPRARARGTRSAPPRRIASSAAVGGRRVPGAPARSHPAELAALPGPYRSAVSVCSSAAQERRWPAPCRRKTHNDERHKRGRRTRDRDRKQREKRKEKEREVRAASGRGNAGVESEK